MGASETTETTQAGIKQIEDWLQKNEYTLEAIEIWQPGSADIKAGSPGKNIFIQVRTVVHPDVHAVLNGTDRFALKDMAERLERTAYIAYVVIDNNKNRVGDIVWERIN